jgi:hypothetical protein
MLRDMLLERGYSLVRNGPFARDPNSFGAAASPHHPLLSMAT